MGSEKKSAAETYADYQNDIGVLLDCIKMELERHAKRAAAEPEDWGFPGDLGTVRFHLKHVLEPFLFGTAGFTEGEISEFIEGHLAEMRASRK